jgi:hypothetical protein
MPLPTPARSSASPHTKRSSTSTILTEDLQGHERLGEGGAAQLEPGGEFALGRQAVAGTEADLADVLVELAGHLLVESPGNPAEAGFGTPSSCDQPV